MIRAKTKLPNRLWKLVDLAVADMKAALRSGKYQVDMNHWHEPNGKCRICMAGAVIAGSLAPPSKVGKPLYPHDFEYTSTKKLFALDRLRECFIVDAVTRFYDYSNRSYVLAKRASLAIGEFDPFNGKLDATERRRLYRTMSRVARKLEELDI